MSPKIAVTRKCNQNHAELCYECNELTSVLSTIERTQNFSLKKKEIYDIKTLKQAKKDIWAWQAHQFPTVNQDQAKYDVLDPLSRRSALLFIKIL